jgi:DNA polymerase-1
MSSEEPNLQNIPRGGWLADAVKSAFVPSRPGWKFVVADYSQVELRVLANLSGDAAMCAKFAAGEDIHSATAAAIFPGLEPSRERRAQAKTVNFGVVYGQTPYGLAQLLKISPKEAGDFIDGFFGAYPAIKPWFETVLEGARKNGYVQTFFGRRRAIPSINDANQTVRNRAQREAINMPVQGTAADVMKFAMVALDRELAARKSEARLLLQVHDELVLECPADEAADVAALTAETMEGATPAGWKARLTAETGVGDDWLGAKK